MGCYHATQGRMHVCTIIMDDCLFVSLSGFLSGGLVLLPKKVIIATTPWQCATAEYKAVCLPAWLVVTELTLHETSIKLTYAINRTTHYEQISPVNPVILFRSMRACVYC